MVRNITILLLAIGSQASAQQWCIPGAEWTYGFANQQASGITRAWYAGDTLVGGYMAQRIDQTVIAYQPSWPFGQAFTQQLDPLHTRVANGVVHPWNGSNNTYDTLIWFDAVPGDHWQVPHSDWAQFDVLDTGTTVVEGIPLRYLVVEEPIVMGVIDTVRERIGFDYFYLDPMQSLLIDWTTVMLHCYRDDDILEFHGSYWQQPCDFTVGVDEHIAAGGLPTPNPGSDHFTLPLPNGLHSIEVFDATGRRVLATSSNATAARIDTEVWPAGTFLVRIIDAQGMSTHHLWVKE